MCIEDSIDSIEDSCGEDIYKWLCCQASEDSDFVFFFYYVRSEGQGSELHLCARKMLTAGSRVVLFNVKDLWVVVALVEFQMAIICDYSGLWKCTWPMK